MTLRHCFRLSSTLVAAAVLLGFSARVWGQAGQVLTAMAPPRAVGVRNSTLQAPVMVQLRSGYHVNSNTPDDDYLIPLVLTWDLSPLQVKKVLYPKAEKVSFAFATKPVSVYSGSFEIVTSFAVPAKAPLGASVITGRLRYQACNNTMCLPPKTVEVRLPLEVRAQ